LKLKINRKNQKEQGFHPWIRQLLPVPPYVNFSQQHSACEIPSLGTPEPLLFPPAKIHRGELHLLLGDTVSTSLSKSNSLAIDGSCAALLENTFASCSK